MDWIAAVFYFAGALLLGGKHKEGFLFYAAENAIWMVIAFRFGLYGLLLIVVIGTGLNVRNYLKWRRANGLATEDTKNLED